MRTFRLSSTELERVNDVIARVDLDAYPFDPVEDHEIFKSLILHAYQLPERLIKFIVDFKYDENNDGVCLIEGFQIDDEKIDDTPSHWKNAESILKTKEEEILLLLCSSFLGDGIGWSTQQEGRIVHNIVPIKGDEHKQEGSSTLTDLFWHTEEAFHPCRCDYLALLCLRNSEQAVTTFASVESLELSDEDRKTLFEPHYSIRPDTSHLYKENSSAAVLEMDKAPEKVPIFYGHEDRPYMCIDPVYTIESFDNDAAKSAYKNVVTQIEKNIQSIILRSGDLLLIDNCRAVHGRKSFKAIYDSKSRWLKRLNITRDLRKSSSVRTDFRDRIIHT